VDAVAPAARTVPLTAADDPRRRRAPGSDWLFVTLGGPAAGQDDVITGPLRECAELLAARGEVEAWFFLRYADPDPQLRLRLRGTPAVLRERVLPAVLGLGADLVAAGVLHKAGVECYDRELERYGGAAALNVAEDVFAADSRAVAALLPHVRDPGERIAVAALGVDELLHGLGLDDAARLACYADLAPPARHTAAAHRTHGPRVQALLGADPAGSRPGDEAVREVLAERRTALLPLGERLAQLIADGACHQPLDVLARSFAHLHCNRLGVDPVAEQTVLGLLLRAARRRRHLLSSAATRSRNARFSAASAFTPSSSTAVSPE
jgi:thiopeptide-type bacteriocin biosynthesis protein